MRTALIFGPVDQLVGAEGVHHPHVVGIVECEPERRAHLGQSRPRLDRAFQRGAVLRGQMFAQVLALCRHFRVQFEGMPIDVEIDACLSRCLGQLVIADHAPRANYIRDDFHSECHDLTP